MISFI